MFYGVLKWGYIRADKLAAIPKNLLEKTIKEKIASSLESAGSIQREFDIAELVWADESGMNLELNFGRRIGHRKFRGVGPNCGLFFESVGRKSAKTNIDIITLLGVMAVNTGDFF